MGSVSCAVVGLALTLVAATPAWAKRSGVVFLDANANGRREPGEAGVAGVVVSDGREVVRTSASGRYELSSSGGRFVFVSRPSDTTCERWYSEGAGDFALVSAPASDDFFFIHFSDAHVYDRAGDPAEFATSRRLSWVPEFLRRWLELRFALRVVEPRFTDDFVAGLRDALAPYRSTEGLGDRAVMAAYREEFERPGSALGDVVPQIREAFAEMAALAPAFFVSTGDQVLEGNLAPPEPLQRWLRFYRKLASTLGAPVYVAIGNNEIAGSSNDDFGAEDPRYGKRSFEAFFGPTHYSFDRGDFHFVALDTHRNDAAPGEDEDWTFTHFPDGERAWLEADLRLHRDRTLVVLNHEPFHFDSSWPFPWEREIRADDEGVLERFGVAYVLAGHVHINGFAQRGATTHITTGALSGMRWALPPELYHRGYRLFYARRGHLYSAWKRTGEPVVGFVDPQGGSALDAAVEVVAVAADRRGSFPQLRLELGGTALPLERWGDYFLHSRLDPSLLEGESGTLVLTATRSNGETLSAELPVSLRAGGP